MRTQAAPVEVKVKVTVPVVIEGVYCVFNTVAVLKLPLGADQIPVVELPVTEPARVTVPA